MRRVEVHGAVVLRSRVLHQKLPSTNLPAPDFVSGVVSSLASLRCLMVAIVGCRSSMNGNQ